MVFSGESPRKREPIVGLQAQADVAAGGRVVVDGHRDRNAVALRERDGQIEIGEEVLEDLDGSMFRCRARRARWTPHRHAPGGDGIGQRNRDGRAVAGASVMISGLM